MNNDYSKEALAEMNRIFEQMREVEALMDAEAQAWENDQEELAEMLDLICFPEDGNPSIEPSIEASSGLPGAAHITEDLLADLRIINKNN